MTPSKPLRPCSVPGCALPAVAGGRCETHARPRQRQRPPDARESASARGYDRHWRVIRAAFLRRHPECADCGAPATEVHHVQSLAEGGTNHWENLMPLCKPCHSRRTRRG